MPQPWPPARDKSGYLSQDTIAAIATALGLTPLAQLPGLSLVAWGATLLESLVGAELQPRLPWLSNEAVNGLMTLMAAALAMVLLG